MTRFRWVVPVVALAALAVGSYWYASGPFEAQAQQETGTCPNARLIDEFTGTGSQETDTFETTTNSFRITYNLEAIEEDPTRGGNLDPQLYISVYQQEGRRLVGTASQEGEGSGETFVNQPPGTFFLDFSVLWGRYTVRVEQCEGGTPSTNPQAGQPKDQPKDQPKQQPKVQPKQQPKGQSRQQPAPPSRPTPSPPEPSFKAGAPSQGPVPLMPNGRCPREFPVKQGGTCWAAS